MKLHSLLVPKGYNSISCFEHSLKVCCYQRKFNIIVALVLQICVGLWSCRMGYEIVDFVEPYLKKVLFTLWTAWTTPSLCFLKSFWTVKKLAMLFIEDYWENQLNQFLKGFQTWINFGRRERGTYRKYFLGIWYWKPLSVGKHCQHFFMEWSLHLLRNII